MAISLEYEIKHVIDVTILPSQAFEIKFEGEQYTSGIVGKTQSLVFGLYDAFGNKVAEDIGDLYSNEYSRILDQSFASDLIQIISIDGTKLQNLE